MGPTPDDSGVVPIGACSTVATASTACSARAAWAASTGASTPASVARSRSRCCTPISARTRKPSQRFQREAIASGRLDHPNIVGVSDFGVLEDGCPYLVMEVLEGESLGERLEREKRIPWPEAIEIMRGVLAGLRHAHERGVVHRDIKPDNIFLAHKDGEVVVKILDFGIAKLYAGSADDPATTRAGLTVGTPAYLSPEQAVGGEITPATDLYSASVVLYEMLAGRAAVRGHRSARDHDRARRRANRRRSPRSRPICSCRAGLEEVVRHGLEKVSAERIATANDYLAALDARAARRRLRGDATARVGPGPRSRRRRPVRSTLPPASATPAAVRRAPMTSPDRGVHADAVRRDVADAGRRHPRAASAQVARDRRHRRCSRRS